VFAKGISHIYPRKAIYAERDRLRGFEIILATAMAIRPLWNFDPARGGELSQGRRWWWL